METLTIVGLDASKTSIMATAIDPLGRRIDQQKLGPGDPEIVKFLESLSGPKRVVLEASNVWEHIYDAAASTGAQVILANPAKTRLIAEATLKTDRVDSEALALLGRLDAVAQAYPPSIEQRALRRLMRDRVFYERKRKDVANHTYAILLQKGIPYEEGILVKKSRRGVLRGNHIAEVDRGLDALVKLEEITRPLDLEVHEAFARSTEAQLLATIPGVGEITATTLVAFLCPIERFHDLDAVVKYCGLCPSVFQSGTTCRTGPLVWDAHKILKWVLIEAQWQTRRRERRGDVARVGKRVARRGNVNDGAVAAARKLARICASVLRRGTAYQPHAPGTSSRHRTIAEP